MVSATTLEKDIKTDLPFGGNVNGASAVGKLIAKRALDNGITEVVFDRGGYIFHGRVAAVAEAAREAGLTF